MKNLQNISGKTISNSTLKNLCSFILLISLLYSIPAKAVTTFFVTSTANAGAGTLNQAITSANATLNSGGNDIISFAGFSGTIILTADLPNITEGVTIDGTTGTGYSFVTYTPVIGLQGNVNGFVIAASGAGSIIKAITIWHTSSDAISVAAGANNVTITNCWIGVVLAGTLPGAPGANKVNGHGINILGANNCVIGGGANKRNIINGCLGHGILVQGGSTGTLISSNYIGLRADGTTIIGNAVHGIVLNNAPSSTIGGLTSADRNVISGNGNGAATNGQGISVENGSINCVIRGNYIGTDATGTAAKANNLHGINVQATIGAIIGGSVTGSGNLISGNTLSGINITTTSTATIIKGNYIGLNAAGTAKIANVQQGIYIQASDNCIIGGPTALERNIVSGNGTAGGHNGISIFSCNGHKIKGNFIGTNANGTAAIGNFNAGLSISTSTGDSIGGQTFMERNIISGNLTHGVFLNNLDASRFYGNYFGTDSTGLVALANAQHGLSADGGSDGNYYYSNVASGNTQEGFDFLGCSNNFLYGNFIGLGKNGTTKISNVGNGVRFGAGTAGISQNNTIGGTAAGQRNYVSGNGIALNSGAHGIIFDGGSSNNIIKGNYIGTDITGSVAIGNFGAGVFFLDGSNSNTVGGTAAGEGNILCCSTGDHGVRINISSSNVVYGNLIGVNAAQVPAAGFGNNQYGVFVVSYANLSNVSNSNIIGSIGAGSNIITNNGSDGVNVFNTGGTASNFNPIIGNNIYCNGGLGINMQTNAATENQGILPPTINYVASTANVLTGTGTNTNIVHAYLNTTYTSTNCNCEGETYIGTATVAGGTWTITHNLNLSSASQLSVSATQTNTLNSTSEFSTCTTPLPLTFISFDVVKGNNNNAILYWETTKELNVFNFEIERSADGIQFESIATIKAKGNYSSINNYEYSDDFMLPNNSYYRIKQVDMNGKYAYSAIRNVSSENHSYKLFPNPSRGIFNISSASANKKHTITLSNTLQETINSTTFVSDEKGNIIVDFSAISKGLYFITIISDNKSYIEKIILE